MEQRAPGTLALWAEPFVPLRVPEALQPAHRPVRAGRYDLEHLLGLVPVQGLHDPRCTGDRDASSSRRSRSSRRARRRRASRSTRRSRRWRTRTSGARELMDTNGLASWRDTADPARRSSSSSSRDQRGRDELRPARGAGRSLRQRRHALVREAAADPGRLHPSSALRDGRGRRRAPPEAALESRVREGLRVARKA